ncbi:hypothetical protein KAW08_03930 [bacterium]|nr:hypothetical protein [bacterium]
MSKDILTKRERVERTLNFQPVDRVAIHDEVSYNPGVISLYTGKKIEGFNYSIEDICEVIKKTLDMCFPPRAPKGTDKIVLEDGTIIQHDNWTSWVTSSPIDVEGLKKHYLKKIEAEKTSKFDPKKEREEHHKRFLRIQKLIGDTVICEYLTNVGLCECWDHGRIVPFSYLCHDEPELISEYFKIHTDSQIRKVHAIADKNLSPVILIADDLASKTAPMFSPEFLRREYSPHLTRLVEAWHEHGLKVLFHSDGNWKILIPDFLKCGVDGFYCLEPATGMDIIELKKKYPKVIWAGGLDGVDLMERGNPEQVRKEVRKQILETDVLNTGGLFLATSSEINPPIKPENYQAMIEEAKSIHNKEFTGE